ncbi:hypothetical protein WDU94_009775 [Cyamophila willieti]
MGTTEQDHVYIDGLKALQERMGVMFNNVQFSDTEFTVKERKFYALSQLVAVSSTTLNDQINFHYANCNDKKIKLYGVKFEESFTIILQYMYGLNINFSQMNLAVLCEVIHLAERFKLMQFFQDLKCYLSKVTDFQIDSIAVLLNTANKYNLKDLYEKLSQFAYQNATDFVKHESVVNLEYHVLLDLIKSDWFYAPEIDILTGVLNWHDDMRPKKIIAALMVDNENDFGVDDLADIDLDMSDIDIEDDTKQDQEEIEHEKDSKYLSKLEWSQEAGSSKACTSNAIATTRPSNQTDKCSEVVKTFSDNILKSLMLHIRINQMTALEYIGVRETELFAKYKHILDDKKHFHQTSQPRQTYVAVCARNKNCAKLLPSSEASSVNRTKLMLFYRQIGFNSTNHINKVKAIFRVKVNDMKVQYTKSMYPLVIREFRFDIGARMIPTGALMVFLHCVSAKRQRVIWDCRVKCQFSLISRGETFVTEEDPNRLFIFDQHHSVGFLGMFDKASCKRAFESEDIISFNVDFKLIIINPNQG